MKKNDADEPIVEKLKELIDKNGPDYLTDKPNSAYKELAETDQKNTVIAGEVLMLLASGILDGVKIVKDKDDLSREIQKDCCFNKGLSDIIRTLYSKDNNAEWENKNRKGLEQFLAQEHAFRLEGFVVWDAGSCTMDCYYDADIGLNPVKEAESNKGLQKRLKKNPFLSADEIYKFYEKELDEYLNRKFEEYSTCDDYYEHVVEDFELESYVEDWCKKNGFKLISCEDDGRDGGFDAGIISSDDAPEAFYWHSDYGDSSYTVADSKDVENAIIVNLELKNGELLANASVFTITEDDLIDGKILIKTNVIASKYNFLKLNGQEIPESNLYRSSDSEYYFCFYIDNAGTYTLDKYLIEDDFYYIIRMISYLTLVCLFIIIAIWRLLSKVYMNNCRCL